MTEGKKVTWTGIISNVVLSAAKLIIGTLGRSQAMVADAIHSISDIIATGAVLLGLNLAEKPEDENHPYGHGKIESIIALFMGLFLFMLALYIMWENIHNLREKNFIRPEVITFFAALLSILLKEWLYRYTISAGRRLNSPAIIANAYDHRSDVFSSCGVLIGISGTYLGLPQADAGAAIIVSLFIIRISYKIAREAIDDLMDSQIPKEIIKRSTNILNKNFPDIEVRNIRGRRLGSKFNVEITVKVHPYSDISTESRNAEAMKESILQEIPEIQDILFIYSADHAQIKSDEKQFRHDIRKILDDHTSENCRFVELDYHFLPQQLEVHFTVVVPRNSSIEESHDVTEHIQEEIHRLYPEAEVLIHIEPESNQ